MRCIATFSLVLYSAPFSDTQDRLPWRTSRIRRVPGVPQLAPVYPGTPARASTRTQLTLPAGLGPRSAAAAQSGGEARMGRCAGDESDDGVGVRIQRAVLSRAYSTGSSAYRAGRAAARSRAVARGRAGAHARRGDRGRYVCATRGAQRRARVRTGCMDACGSRRSSSGCVNRWAYRTVGAFRWARRLSGRAVHCAPTARACLAGKAALGDPHERAGDAERAHAGKRSSPHAPFITMAIGKRAL